jgi:hypothetical protein
LSTTGRGISTTTISTDEARSRIDGDAEAGRLQGGVELAVLHELDGFVEGQVLDLAEVLVGQAGALEDRAGVELRAGLRRADREALALQVASVLMPESLEATTWM